MTGLSKSGIGKVGLSSIFLVLIIGVSSCSTSRSSSGTSSAFAGNSRVSASQIAAAINNQLDSGKHGFSITSTGKIGQVAWTYHGVGALNYSLGTGSEISVDSNGIPYNSIQVPSLSQIPILSCVFSRQEIYWQTWGTLASVLSKINKSWVSLSISDTLAKTSTNPVLLLAGESADPFTFTYLLSSATSARLIKSTSLAGNSESVYSTSIPTSQAESSVPGMYSGIIGLLSSFTGGSKLNLTFWIDSSSKLDQVQWSYSNGKHLADVVVSFVGSRSRSQRNILTPPSANETIDLSQATNTLSPPTSATGTPSKPTLQAPPNSGSSTVTPPGFPPGASQGQVPQVPTFSPGASVPNPQSGTPGG